MGLLYTRFLANLNEAEVDGQPIGDEPETTNDYTATEDGNNNPTNDQSMPQENIDQNPPPNDSTPSEEPPPEDYTAGEYGGGYPDDGTQQPYNNVGGSQPPVESEVDDIKKQEEELYNELTPEQLDIKHKELKTQYLKMYDSVMSIIDRLGDVNVAEENISTVEYASNTLANIKQMLSDYVNDVYQTKSFIENSINYNKFLAVLNGVNKILEEMNSKKDKN